MSRSIQVYDTTLRDGSQGEGIQFSLLDKLHITQELDRLGVDYIEGGYPLSNPKDAAYFQEVAKLSLTRAKITAFGMTRRRGCAAPDDVGLKALDQAGTEIVTLVGKTWDLHVTDVLGVDLEENLAMIRDSVGWLRSRGRRVFFDAEHFFDGLRRNRSYGLDVLRAAEEAGAEALVLCDTNGGSQPDWIAEAIDLVRGACSADLGIHCHNDGDLATANTLRAVERGAIQVQGTINGIGERCGNTDLLAVIGNLAIKNGRNCLAEGGLARLTEVSRFVYEKANIAPRNGQPFVGSSAFAHKGGMHVHAVEKSPITYEHIDPTLVGNTRKILISELSGRSNVLALDQGRHGLNKEEAAKVLDAVQNLENEGYQFESSEASFDLLVRRTLGRHVPYFTEVAHRVSIEKDRTDEPPVTEATVKVKVGGRTEHTVGEGDGPVNALDAALRKAVEHHYPPLRDLRLIDYKVRVVNAGAGTAARVRVTIESRDTRDVWGTVGVHENIVEASWRALVDSFEYKLHKERVEPIR
jgi:2-isopropylmalate synthase